MGIVVEMLLQGRLDRCWWKNQFASHMAYFMRCRNSTSWARYRTKRQHRWKELTELAIVISDRSRLDGKGGSGKTVVSGTLARSIANAGHDVLAIDDDDDPHLEKALGIPPEASLPSPPDDLVTRREASEGELPYDLSSRQGGSSAITPQPPQLGWRS